METVDITKDPYFLKNHLGTFECKLCLTLHPNEVSISYTIHVPYTIYHLPYPYTSGELSCAHAR
ncbi:hypothetical protein EON63_13590 [archaeon]|nr:MAG: hypothetical protein EON63_13590 [archaeon]